MRVRLCEAAYRSFLRSQRDVRYAFQLLLRSFEEPFRRPEVAEKSGWPSSYSQYVNDKPRGCSRHQPTFREWTSGRAQTAPTDHGSDHAEYAERDGDARGDRPPRSCCCI